MKKQILFVLLYTTISFSVWGQKPSISFTKAMPVVTEAGTTLKVNYKYTTTSDKNIYCGINLQDDWTWVSFIGGDGKIVTAGTDVEGSLDILIPKGTKPTADLKGRLNYKINIEMKSLHAFTWIAGDYPATSLNIVAPK